jgi:hypothetical protein
MLEIEIDGTRYGWEHGSCHCFGHCNTDRFYVDGEPYGEIDNPALCSFVHEIISEVELLRSIIERKNETA